ncbi:ABHD14 [Mytilus edulis]|uniref:ABHD14 n=1 Tax=Mytilus edulis TaxID=6550 RepID=A0A8S3RIE0_MYTED|nr:ABHD14 [Mytilus edulis]
MTPPGVHINKTALAIIIGLLVVIILGFKYKRGTDSAFFDKLSDRKTESILQQQSKIRDVQLEELKKEPEKEIKKEPENQEVNKEQKQVELNKEPENQQVNKELEKTQGNKEPEKHKKENMAAVDWKTVDINSVIIPDEIVKSATEKMKVEEKTYKVMDLNIFARTVKPEGECKGGVVLLHGQSFTSKNWAEIKTLQYIGAMGYTPMAVDLPNFGNSDKKDVDDDELKFMEELMKAINFTAPVIVSPSMSGKFSLPFLLSDPKNANKKSHGFIPVAPVIPENYKQYIKELQIPAAIVYGDKDLTFKNSVENVLSKLPNSRLFKIKDARHPAYLDQPEIWHKIIYIFLPAAFK